VERTPYDLAAQLSGMGAQNAFTGYGLPTQTALPLYQAMSAAGGQGLDRALAGYGQIGQNQLGLLGSANQNQGMNLNAIQALVGASQQGQANLNPLLSLLGNQVGQTQGNALQAAQMLGQAQLPYMDLANQALGRNQTNLLNAFNAVPQVDMSALGMANDIANRYQTGAFNAAQAIPNMTSPFLQLAQQQAQAQTGQGMQMFDLLNQAQVPYLQMANQIAQGQQANALDRYNIFGNQVNNLMGTLQNTALAPMQMAEQIAQQRRALDLQGYGVSQQQQNALLNNLQQNIGNAMGFLGGQQAYGMNQADIASALVGAIVSGNYQRQMQTEAIRAQQSQTNRGLLGTGIGAIASLIPFLAGLSHRNFKHDIEEYDDLEGARERVMSIPLRTFQYRQEILEDGDKVHLGWVNDEVPEELVSKDGKFIDVISVLGHLVATVQQQQQEISELRRRYATLG